MEKWRQDFEAIGYPVDDYGKIDFNGYTVRVAWDFEIYRFSVTAKNKRGKEGTIIFKILTDSLYKDFFEHTVNLYINIIESDE